MVNLSPKRDVIDHLLKNGHTNPSCLQGIKLLTALREVAGLHVQRKQYRPQTRLPEQLIIMYRQHRAGREYEKAVALQTEVKATLERLNNFFYEVMRDRNPDKPFATEDMKTILQVFEVYWILQDEPKVLSLLCSPVGDHVLQGITYLQRLTAGNRKYQEKATLIARIVRALRELTDILAAEPVLA